VAIAIMFWSQDGHSGAHPFLLSRKNFDKSLCQANPKLISILNIANNRLYLPNWASDKGGTEMWLSGLCGWRQAPAPSHTTEDLKLCKNQKQAGHIWLVLNFV
jgi:hypothetical protein